MTEEMNAKIIQHEKWLDSLRQEGEQLAVYGIDFRNYSLSGKYLEKAYLNDCIYDGVILNDTDFETSFMCMSSYKNTEIKRCNFRWVDLSYSCFLNARLISVNFSKSDCTEVDFTNANIVSCKFSEANLYMADFSNANLEGVTIIETHFDQTILGGASMKKMKGIDKADFRSINIGTAKEPVMLEGEEARKWVELHSL